MRSSACSGKSCNFGYRPKTRPLNVAGCKAEKLEKARTHHDAPKTSKNIVHVLGKDRNATKAEKVATFLGDFMWLPRASIGFLKNSKSHNPSATTLKLNQDASARKQDLIFWQNFRNQNVNR